MVSIVLMNSFDYLVAAIDRAVARGWEAEADALGQLYQATGAALDSDAGAPGRIQAALEGIQRVDPRRARAIRPAFEGLISGLEFELRMKEVA
ncbi:hypothetical protein [Oceanithermus sp.]|uniref:hypothetical protein n=1 Tax=Oceanithermus sp. TaxID=2268145 RepID=UPI0025E588DB|nr:hypothetical protein [Oceanithermus sp.]